jgi:phosphate transport system substrate-binding protein
MRKINLFVSTILLGFSLESFARDQIKIVGSSTVYPFATVVAERFGKTSGFKTPVIESTGSGGGLKLFCNGLGTEHPDITNASRRIKMKEVKRCNDNGVKDFTEIKIGFDGIAIANAKDGPNLELTLKDVYLALAKLVPADPKGDTVKPNPYKMWNEVNPNLPEIPIVVIGPPPTSGTRDAFNELAIERGCKKFSGRRALKSKDKNLYKKECRGVREDGPYVEAGENDNLIIEKLVSDPGALGVFGYSFLDQNKDKVKASKIDGVLPEFENISSGKYPVSRSLFFYVKNAHAAVIPGIKEYVKEFTASRTVGADGYLIEKGLIPLPEGERSTFEKDGQTLAKFDSSVLKKK